MTEFYSMNLKITFQRLLSLTIAGFLLLNSFKPVNHNESENVRKPRSLPFFSERLSKEAAEALRNNYKNSPDVLTTIDNSGNEVRLETFSFEARDIREILAKLNTSPGTQDKLAFKFAMDNTVKKRWRLLVYGMTNDNLLEDYDQTSGKFSIFHNSDYASPQATRKRKGEALALRSMYENSRLLKTIDMDGNTIPLYGFSFNADHIDEIINNNASGEKSPDKLVLYIGLEPVSARKRWHVIAYGIKSNVLLDYFTPGRGKGSSIGDEMIGGASIFDKAAPCPPCK